MSSNSGNTYITYVDESGDPGTSSKSSLTFTLGSISVEASEWNEVSVRLRKFRKRLEHKFGLPLCAEVRANSLIRNGGDFARLDLNSRQRALIFRSHLALLNTLNVNVQSIVGHKVSPVSQNEVFNGVWNEFINGLQMKSTKGRANIVIHDESDNFRIRNIANLSAIKSARNRSDNYLVEVPFALKSHETLFLQFADLVAYAAFRHLYEPSVGISQIVPKNSWLVMKNK